MTDDFLFEYNQFCESISEGSILYNLDKTNGWGDYLLVANKATVKIQDLTTYTMMLLGLEKKKDKFSLRNLRIKLTPDYVKNVPFLKQVGKCRFRLIPELLEVNVNQGLAVVYGSVNLNKFKQRLGIRKPVKRKYGKDGKLIIKKVEND